MRVRSSLSAHKCRVSLNYKTDPNGPDEREYLPLDNNAVMAQLVARNLAKVKVVGSNPIYRSNSSKGMSFIELGVQHLSLKQKSRCRNRLTLTRFSLFNLVSGAALVWPPGCHPGTVYLTGGFESLWDRNWST